MVRLIWATRGRSWGFRFLLKGGYTDPLATYERVFADSEGDTALCRQIGDEVALRFRDPLGRMDASGRVIPHDFVLFAPLAENVTSVEEGLELVWPLVSDIFADVWEGGVPSAEKLESTLAVSSHGEDG